MDKDQLMRFINTILERRPSDTMVFSQLADILKEQNAPQEYLDLIEIVDSAHRHVMEAFEKKSEVTESDLREAERKHRKDLEERAGRC